MMKKMILILLGFLFLCTLSCKKETPEDPFADLPYYPIDPDFKAYFVPAKDSSWWVYYDSTKNSYDTVTVEQFSEIGGNVNVDQNGEAHGWLYDGSTVTYASTLGVRYNIRVDAKSDGSGYRARMYIYGQGYAADIEYVNGVYQNCNILDSVSVNGNKYYDVIEVTDGIAYRPIWFVEGIGIVYKERSAGNYEDFELIDYYINPN